MICSGCGADAASDFRFCPRCGRALPRACPGCGVPVAADFAFCPRCGSRLAGAEPPPRAPGPGDGEEDRRVVTVLFADLAGFTALAERLDPEEVRGLQEALFATLAAVVERYGGFVEKFVGDAVMAVFGAPVAHEDDPERALHAALAMHGGVGALSGHWQGRTGAPLRLHVGVATGPVVAGTLGGAPGAAYAVTGDTVNTAARLLQAAGPDETLVSATTWAVTHEAFTLEPRGLLEIRGKAAPVAAYRLVGPRRGARPSRGLDALGLRAPLVGRAAELEALRAAVAQAGAGRAQVVRVVGEAGVGKSRLVRELLTRLDADGPRDLAVRLARCSSLGEPPHGVLASFLRAGYGLEPEDPVEVVREKVGTGLAALGAEPEVARRIAPVLGYLVGLEGPEGPHHLEPAQLRRQVLLAVRSLLEERLRRGPLLLVVEDAHWADAASLELLGVLLDRLADRPLALVLTQRPPVDPEGLPAERVPVTTVRLLPLTPGESEALLRAWFGPALEGVPRSLVGEVIARAGGNPFYLEELIRALIADGQLAREAGGWVWREGAARDVPLTVQALLLARLDRLPPPVRRLAQAAAVLGPTFDPTLLPQLTDDPGAAEGGLDALRRAGLVEPVGEADADLPARARGPWRFAHALLHEVAYQTLLLRRRTALHGRAAAALVRRHGETPERLEDLETLAYHLSRGPDPRQGARCLVRTGDWARSVCANGDAVRHYRRALEVLTACEAGPLELAPVRERLGDLLGPLGRRAEALEHYEAVRRVWAQAGVPATEARLLRKIGGLRWEAGDRAAALHCFEEALARLGPEGEPIERAHLYQEMGRLAARSGDHRAAAAWAEGAVAQAVRACEAPAGPEEREEAAAALSQAHNTLGVALARAGRPQEAVRHLAESVAVAEAHGLLRAACRGFANLSVVQSTLDPAQAIETCRRGLQVARRIGDLGFQSRLQANLAVAYCALTNRCDDEAVAAAREAAELDRQLGLLDHLAIPIIVLAQIAQCHGQPDRALGLYRQALELAEAAGEPQLQFPCYDGLATLYLERGEDMLAEEYLQRAQQVCARAGLEPDSLVLLPFLD